MSLLFIFMFFEICHAEKMIDLGNLEVECHVRKPTTKVIDTSITFENALKKMASKEFLDFEATPLKFPKEEKK